MATNPDTARQRHEAELAALALLAPRARFNLAALVKVRRPGARKRSIVVRPIEPTQALASDLYRACYKPLIARIEATTPAILSAYSSALTVRGPQGFTTTTPAAELHVTVAFSRTPLDWMKIGQDWSSDASGNLTVPAGGPRIVQRLGDKGAVVLLFGSNDLAWRHKAILEAGASFDFDEYQPHVTITYAAPADLDLAKVQPYTGPLKFGPELFSEVDEDWASGITEDAEGEQSRPFGDANPNHWPAGSGRRSGQFAPKGAGGFLSDLIEGSVANAAAIESATGLRVHGLTRIARAADLNHASKFSKKGRVPPSQSVLRHYSRHATLAHSFKLQGQRGHGSGLRLRSEIAIGKRSYTLIERVGERSGTLAFVTMWENA